MTQRLSRIIEMFENVEHQNQGVTFCRTQIRVKGSDSNPRAVPTVRIDELRIGFNAFDIAEFREPVKEETVAAAYVQDVERSLRCDVLAQNL